MIHDNPDRRPNRIAFTLIGPSPILRCWFGKGTQVSISTDPFADAPPPFSFLWTCRRPGVSSPYGGLAPMCLRCCGSILTGVARLRYFVDMCVAEWHTARWPWLCVLFVHRLAVWV